MTSAERDAPQQTATMKVTTVRFGRDLWRLLEIEAAAVGTSVSQYIREAALARAAAAAGARDESPFELLASAAHGLAESAESPRERAEIQAAIAVIRRAHDLREEAEAVHSQSAQVAKRAIEVGARSDAVAARKRRSGGEPELP